MKYLMLTTKTGKKLIVNLNLASFEVNSDDEVYVLGICSTGAIEVKENIKYVQDMLKSIL